MHSLAVWLFVISLGLAGACNPQTLPVGDVLVTWDCKTLKVTWNENSAIVWQSIELPFLQFQSSTVGVTENNGMYDIKETTTCVSQGQTVDSFISISNDAASSSFVQLSGLLYSCAGLPNRTYTLTIAPTETPSHIQLSVNTMAAEDEWKLNEFSQNEIFVILNAESVVTEGVYGFGVQYTHLNLKGRVLPIITSEQGIGRGLEPLTTLLNIVNRGGGDWHTSYAPVPYYLTTRTRGFAVENTDYTVFDLSNDSKISVIVMSSNMSSRIILAATPLEIIGQYTLYCGRMSVLPDWILSGAVVGWQGGTGRVLEVYQQLQEFNVPLAAFWLQDWTGQRNTSIGVRLWWNWELDEQYYYNWPQFCELLAQDDVKIMTYINPFLANNIAEFKPNYRRNLFEEAAELGYLVMNETKQPYILMSGTEEFTFGMIDLTNSNAIYWYQQVIQQNMMAYNQSGWMADFGEYLPFDAIIASSSSSSSQTQSSATVHNLYPQLWSALNRNATNNSDDDIVFFHRSGAAKSPSFATLFWLGDQLVTWDEHDGLRSAVRGALSSGMSGFALTHSDIGGYTMVKEFGFSYLRSKELLLRWMEMSAILDVVFRTHLGTLPDESWQINSDNDTLLCFARAATLHSLFSPYRLQLMEDLQANGTPLIRHLWLMFPIDVVAREIDDEYMLGDDFLVAPTVTSNATTITAYLPRGTWTHLWTNQTYSSHGVFVTLPVPFGSPTVFFKSDSIYGPLIQNNLNQVTKFSCVGV